MTVTGLEIVSHKENIYTTTTGYYNRPVFTDAGIKALEKYLNTSKIKTDDEVYFDNSAMYPDPFKGGSQMSLDYMGVPLKITKKRNHLLFFNAYHLKLENPTKLDTDEVWYPTREELDDHFEPGFVAVTIQYFGHIKNDPSKSFWAYHPFIRHENNYVNPFPNGIPAIADIDFTLYRPWADHCSTFAMVVGNGKLENEDYHFLRHNLAGYYEDDDELCEDCYEGDCDDCNRSSRLDSGVSNGYQGLRGEDSSCWGNGMPVLRAVQNTWGLPTHMILLFDNESLWNQDNDLADIQRFYRYMQQAGIIPTKGVKLLTEDDVDNDCTVYFSGLGDMSPEKMYFIFCCLRTPVQHPGIVRLTNKLIEDKDMDPLYAFLMAQVLHPSFQGGHAVVSPGKLRFYTDIAWDDRMKNRESEHAYPILDKIVEFALRATKLIDQDRGEDTWIKNCYRSNWALDSCIARGKNDFYPTDLKQVSVRYSKSNLKLTPENMLGLQPRERRIVI
jgi:hypothetical protein